MTTYGPFVDAVPRTLIRSQQANQIIDLLQSAEAGTVLTGVGPGILAMQPLTSGGVLLGLGGGEQIWPTSVAYDISSARGTSAAPVTEAKPNIKVQRIENISALTMPNPSENQLNAAIVAFAQGVGTSTAQATAIMAHAFGGGTTAGADVSAVNAQAYVNVPGSTGVATGLYGHAQRDVATGVAVAAELRPVNQTATPSTYDPLGVPASMALWINAGGLASSAAAVVIANYSAQTFQAGYVVHGTNPVTGASFRDDGNAAVSLDIQGSHIYGIETSGATLSTSGALRMANGQYVMGRSGDNTADWALVGSAGTTVRVGGAAPTLDLRTNAASRWQIDTSGHLRPSADNTQDLGSGSFRIRSLTAASLTAPTIAATNVTAGTAVTAPAITATNLAATSRIFGDFTTAPDSSRTQLQTNVVNGITAVGVLPHGTATASALTAYAGSNPDAAAYMQIAGTPGVALITAGRNGAAAWPSLAFTTSAFTRLSLEANGDIVLSAGALAVADTAGHLHLPSCAGTPTGVPGSYTGRVPVVMDSAAGKLWARVGGAWKSVTFV